MCRLVNGSTASVCLKHVNMDLRAGWTHVNLASEKGIPVRRQLLQPPSHTCGHRELADFRLCHLLKGYRPGQGSLRVLFRKQLSQGPLEPPGGHCEGVLLSPGALWQPSSGQRSFLPWQGSPSAGSVVGNGPRDRFSLLPTRHKVKGRG